MTGSHLWQIQLIGLDDLERDIPVCIKSHNSQYLSDQKLSHEVQETLH